MAIRRTTFWLVWCVVALASTLVGQAIDNRWLILIGGISFPLVIIDIVLCAYYDEDWPTKFIRALTRRNR